MKTDNYYLDKTRINNSSLGYFLKSPLYFHKMMTGEITEPGTTSMDFGTALHMAILQPEEFRKTYSVADFEIPLLKQQKMFCEQFISNREKGPKTASFDAYIASYATKGKSDDKIQKEALQMMIKYKKYIQSISGKQYISWYQYNKIVRLKNNAKKHKLANELLSISPINGHIDVNNEYHINWELNNVDCKSLLDRVIVDEDSKIITLIDLKTTSHIAEFESSVKKYDYFRQMQFYKMAIEYKINNGLYKYSFKDYEFRCYIIAFDTSDTEEVRVYDMKETSESNGDIFNQKKDLIESIIKQIKWHNENGLWDHSYTYYNGNGAELLNINK